jgi:hypothetical protein
MSMEYDCESRDSILDDNVADFIVNQFSKIDKKSRM